MSAAAPISKPCLPGVTSWLILLLRSVFVFAVGLLAFGDSGLRSGSLSLCFGAYAITDGILILTSGMARRYPGARWLTLVEAVIGACAGFLALYGHGLNHLLLLLLIAEWALITGLLRTAAIIRQTNLFHASAHVEKI